MNPKITDDMGGGIPPSDTGEIVGKKYKYYYIPVIENTTNKKYRNWQAIDYLDLPISLKEVNIDLDYSKITPDFLKYKLNLVVPNKNYLIYDFLFRDKNAINAAGKEFDPKQKKKIILNPSDFELNKVYDANYIKNYVKEKYGKEWYIVSDFKVLKCEVPMDIYYQANESVNATNYYVNVNNFVPEYHKKWIQYDKQSNWKEVNEVFDFKFKALVKELWYHSGNSQVVFAWIATILIFGLPFIALPHYYHTVIINTVEFWIQKDEKTNFEQYPYSTKLLFENNFILTPSTWKNFASSLGEIEPFDFNINPGEKLIIKGLFLPRVIEINNAGFILPNIKNLTQLHIKHIE
ncbi:hypothetical protein [Metamycoplasma hyosynoviae]|uniref:hypothetical protein n=1 Tax=Metamycoplasma hyosynoviae TaxID=29559 RepID=UPI00236604B6|nr:hypothetical protein [Metamycoplasma hyosynoviae]MDD7884012.1 hypothetical protein [Metamycoplasma hyosynoviae]MDD7894293.1 hypothetical protein [Metamycoplasma hyosynoviae]